MLIQTEKRTTKSMEDKLSLFFNSLTFRINSLGIWSSSISKQASYTSNDIEIVFYTKGGSYTQIEDRKYICSINHLMILKPFGLVTSINEDHDQYEYYYIHFDILPSINTQHFLDLLTYPSCVIMTNSIIQNIIYAIFEEKRQMKLGYQGIINALLKQLCIEIIRIQGKDFKHIPEFLENHDTSTIVSEAMQRINNHIYDTYSIASLAFEMGISESYLYKSFKSVLDMSPSNYMAKRKMLEAKKLLASGLYTISEIADMLNYSSLYHFSNSFKKVEKCTPRQYQKAMQSPQNKTSFFESNKN